MLAVGSVEIPKNSPSSSRRRSAEGLLLSLSGYGGIRARRSPKGTSDESLKSATEDDNILRSHSFSSVSLLQNRVTATAAIPAVPAISVLREMSPVPEKSAVAAIPDLLKVPATSPSTSSSCLTSKRSIFDYPDTYVAINPDEMPKKSSSGERKSSTRLFRSVSALSSRKHSKDNAGKDSRERTTSAISDSDRGELVADRSSTNLEAKIDVQDFESELREMNSKLVEMTSKLHNAEVENENLKSLLSANYNGPVKSPLEDLETDSPLCTELKGNAHPLALNTVYSSKLEGRFTENVIEASGYAVRTNHSNHCKECDKLKETTIKALVESIALRKYVRQLSEALSGGDQAKKDILVELETKLISAQTEKEVALEELAHVIEQRDQIVSERDRALEEWGKAASKWESTLDQVDSLMKELNKVKSSREDMVFQIEKAESRIKQEMDSREKLLEDFAELNEQLNSTERERIDSMSEHENITKRRFEREQEFQKTKTELGKAQQRCLELDAKLTALTDKSESCKKERDHAKEQWRHSVKERKKLHREMAVTVQARDEAIQKCFSTAEKLDKLKEDYNRLLNRLARTGLASSDSVSTCSSKDCNFCSSHDSSGSFEDFQRPDGKEITTSLSKEDPLDSIKIGRLICHARAFTGIMDVDKALGAAKNVRKYDEIISINDIPVTENDQNLVRSLFDGATSDIKLVLRRPVNNCQITFDVEMRMPKKSKAGLGFDCGLYVKDMSFGGTSLEQKTLEVGDYIQKINGKHLDKIVNSCVEKVVKKSTDKVKFHITRTIKANPHSHDQKAIESDSVVLRHLPGSNHRSTANDVNRISMVSNDSSISMKSRDSRLSGGSSFGSMVSNNDSCFADSSSDHSGPLHSTPASHAERMRIPTAIYIPSDEPLDSVSAGVITDELHQSSELFMTDGKNTDTIKRMRNYPISQMGRKYNSTTVLKPTGYDSGSDYGLTRTQSTIAATRIDEEDRWDGGLGRTGTVEILVPTSDRVRVMRLEKEVFQSLGLEVIGGNLVGIYVKELTKDSVCRTAGLEMGDRLIKLNCYDFTRTTLDHATRIVRLLGNCTYVRIEAESGEYYNDVLKQTPHDSIYVRTITSYKAMSPDELSFTIGETLHVINTRANYDQAKQSWKWVAMRKDGKNIDEGLVPCMGTLPEHMESAISASQMIPNLDADSIEDIGSDDGGAPMKRGGSERRSFLQRYRKMRRRDGRDPLGSGIDLNGNTGKVTYYEILSKLK